MEPVYAAELKVDGLSLSLVYENRRLVQAVTRGNGDVGEEVTDNARTIADLPVTLPEDAPAFLEVRGEVFLSRRRWEELNRERDLRGEPFANRRRELESILSASAPPIHVTPATSESALSSGEHRPRVADAGASRLRNRDDEQNWTFR